MKNTYYPADNGLLALIEERCGWHQASRVEHAFNTIGLPAPAAGEFIKTNEGGYLVLADAVGLAVRMTLNNWPLHVSDAVLQPLGSFETEFFRIDVNPGIRHPVKSEDYIDYIYPALRKDGLSARDCRPINAGFLPNRDASRAILDTPCVYREFGERARKGATPIQDKIFGSLKRDFAIAEATENPKHFVKACIEAKADGILVSNWSRADAYMDFDLDNSDIPSFKAKFTKRAQKYNQRVRTVLNI